MNPGSLCCAFCNLPFGLSPPCAPLPSSRTDLETKHRNASAASEIKKLFTKRHPGSVKEPSEIEWQFSQKFVARIKKIQPDHSAVDMTTDDVEEFAIENDGEEVIDEADEWVVLFQPNDEFKITALLEEKELPYVASVVQYPTATAPLSPDDYDALDELLLRVEEEPNVTAVTTTAERQEA